MKKTLATIIAAVLVLTLAMPVFASVNSPEQKGNLNIIPQDAIDGSKQDCLVFSDDNHTEISPAVYNPNGDLELIITPLSGKDSAPAAEIKTALETAKSEVDAAAKVSDLCDISAALKVLQNASSDAIIDVVTIDDYVIDELFDASFVRGNSTYVSLEKVGAKEVDIKFATSYKESDGIIVISECGPKSWEVVESELAADGSLTIHLKNFGAIAFAKITDGFDPSGRTSPKTGDNTGAIVTAVLCAAAVLCIGGCILVDKKRA